MYLGIGISRDEVVRHVEAQLVGWEYRYSTDRLEAIENERSPW